MRWTAAVRDDVHPVWCAQGHHCTAELGGEHASEPTVWRTPLGRLVATRWQPVDGRPGHMEYRFVVPLPAGEERAQRFAQHLASVMQLAITRVLGPRV